jgi:hypothetical protein
MCSLGADLPPLMEKNMVLRVELIVFVTACFQSPDLDYSHWASARRYIPRQKQPWMLRCVNISRLPSPGKRFKKKIG